jgi:NADH-quinone oxidoreductase subunit H
MAILTAALATFAVIPFGSVLPSSVAVAGAEQPIQLIVAPGVDVGMLYVFALSSMAVYGVTLGGWASNNKYSFLGGLRSSAQLIAYEIPLGLGILGVVLMTGSLRLEEIIGTQAESGVWFAFSQPLGLLVFSVAACAEAGRLPFDLPEAEQELVGGYHTEYAGVKLLMYLVGEFLHMITASFLIVILFFGGWHFWGVTGSGIDVTWLQAILRIVVLLAKILGVVLMFMLVRWSWPRFRFDQLMALAWKVMLPLGLVHLVTMAVVSEYADSWAGGATGWLSIAVGWAVAIVACTVAGMVASITTGNQAVRE